MSKTGMQQTYQFKNTKGYGYNVEDVRSVWQIWKGLTTKTNWIIKQYDSTTVSFIDEYSEKPIQHTGIFHYLMLNLN
jgi:hypothetical protein